MRRVFVASVWSWALSACAPGGGAPLETQTARSSAEQFGRLDEAALTTEVERIASRARATVGVGALSLPDGRGWFLRGDEPFPMASVYKLPIALAVLGKVDRGELSLDAAVPLMPEDVSVWHSPLASDLPPEGRVLSIRALLEAMIVESDNTASDLLLRSAGGAGVVTANLVRAGVRGVRVDRSELAIAQDFLRAARPGTEPPARAADIERMHDELSEEERARAFDHYASDPRDTATPRGLVALLDRFRQGELVSEASGSLLRGFLERARPRLGLKLPAGTRVAHKTGTGFGTFNDAGIVTTGDGRELLLAIVTKRAEGQSLETGSELVADVARAVYDAFGTASVKRVPAPGAD